MRRAVLVLDGSESMNSSTDFQPNRLLALWPLVTHFASAFLEADPVARMSIIVARDGVARRVCAATSSAESLAHAIEEGYVAPRGSGAFSLENCVQAVAAELGDVMMPMPGAEPVDSGRGRRPPQPAGDSVDPSTPRQSSFAEVILVCGSVTSVDAGDVLKTIDSFVHRGLAVGVVPCWNVISLDGAPHILNHIATATGGVLQCPMHAEHLARQLLSLCPVVGHAGTLVNGNVPRQPEVVAMTGVGAVTAIGPQRGLCPLCHLRAPTLPAPCRGCGIALISEAAAARAMLASRVITWIEAASNLASSSCVACAAQIASGDPVYRCDACDAGGSRSEDAMCAACRDYAHNELHMCPICGAAGA